MAYSHLEDIAIVSYIVENNLFHKIKGDQVWKEMEEKKVLDRTWQSMKQHFRKTIIYEITLPRYKLGKESISLFREYFFRNSQRREPAKNKAGKEFAPPGKKYVNLDDLSSSSDDDRHT